MLYDSSDNAYFLNIAAVPDRLLSAPGVTTAQKNSAKYCSWEQDTVADGIKWGPLVRDKLFFCMDIFFPILRFVLNLMHIPKLDGAGSMGQWRTLIVPVAVASLGLSGIWILTIGLARDPRDALMRVVLSYPLSFILICVSVAPGIYLVKLLRINPWWTLPSTAVLIYVSIGAAKSWASQSSGNCWVDIHGLSGYNSWFPC